MKPAQLSLISMAFVIALLGCASTSSTTVGVDGPVDSRANKKVRALYRNLKDLPSDKILFGHQDALAYGVTWDREKGRSDVKDVTGAYPAVFGWELAQLELGYEQSLDSVRFDELKGWIKEAYRIGGVITISWHMGNPVSGGNSWDTTRAVHTILPGGENHGLFKTWLDRFVDFNSALKVGAFKWLGLGTHVPIVFRPFHEHTGSWFWWGGRNVTADEYVQLWRFTVEYLRDEKGIHNLLYAYSPDKFNSLEEYLEYYPGDEYVDILGVDDYSIGRPYGDIEKTAWRLRTVTQLAAERNKIPAMTETGSDRIPDPKWWTGRLLKALDYDAQTRQVAWVLVWRNAHKGHHHAPYPGHSSADDFVQFYRSPLIVFADGLPDMYK